MMTDYQIMKVLTLAITLMTLSMSAFSATPTTLQEDNASQDLLETVQHTSNENLKEEQIKLILKYQSQLLNDSNTPYLGNKNAHLNIIEFFDYECSYCSQIAPTVKSLQEENPHIRFIFKEAPIFSDRWEPSIYAAEVGLEVFSQKGIDAYKDYHNGVYSTGLIRGDLTRKEVKLEAQKVGLIAKAKYDDTIVNKNIKLFHSLKLKGEPVFIIMPSSGANKNNIVIINGADKTKLLSVINSKRSIKPAF